MPNEIEETPTEALRKFIAFTEAQNAKYTKATKAGKRVIIARDVLTALRAKRIEPEPGNYLETADRVFGQPSALSQAVEKDPDASFQELLPKLPPCKGCAKGAIFVCTVMRQNQVQNRQVAIRRSFGGGLFSDDNLSEALQGVFSPSQLNKIENEFECRRVGSTGSYAVMGLQRFTPKRRMQEIMRNIIANNGTFKPVRSEHARPRKYQNLDY